ncbi:MAG: cytochrome c oxidase subunit I, partial [Actinobacteria bacterium]|nr:cytochrome c oxidase subunit I [Actinomycetota bacterium]
MAAKIRQPGWYRALAFSILGVLVCLGLSTGLRAAFSVDPVYDGTSVLQISLLMVPLFFLGGIGCFDYWLRWASGRTVVDDHADHGAKSWRDYFKVNTDHKVIGLQYICVSFFFMFIGGL